VLANQLISVADSDLRFNHTPRPKKNCVFWGFRLGGGAAPQPSLGCIPALLQNTVSNKLCNRLHDVTPQ